MRGTGRTFPAGERVEVGGEEEVEEVEEGDSWVGLMLIGEQDPGQNPREGVSHDNCFDEVQEERIGGLQDGAVGGGRDSEP